MLSFEPPPWDGERVILYHGTLDRHAPSVLASVDLRFARPNQDFGRGFYTTTLKRQAVFWAHRLARRSRSRDRPAVIAFEVALGNLARLESLAFVRGEFEADRFWGFVWRCRESDADHGRASNGGWYDLVVGPVAADWKQRTSIHNSEQLSFHTVAASDMLNASRSWRVI